VSSSLEELTCKVDVIEIFGEHDNLGNSLSHVTTLERSAQTEEAYRAPPGVEGQPRRVYNFDLTNIQPRAGMAYNFLPKTVLRAGFGIFFRTATQDNLTSGFNQNTPYLRSLDGDRFPSAGGLTGPYSLEDPWPQGVIRPAGASLGPLTNIGSETGVDGRDRRIPRTYQWSFGIERELPWSTVIEVSDVGSRTHFEPRTSRFDDMPLVRS
jgi:hypothetical protein